MQFQIIFTLLGLGASLVSSSPVLVSETANGLLLRDVPTPNLTLDAADCEPLKCLEVVAAVGCIVVAMDEKTDKPESALSCVASNTDKLCQCAGCISGLGNFLTNNKVC